MGFYYKCFPWEIHISKAKKHVQDLSLWYSGPLAKPPPKQWATPPICGMKCSHWMSDNQSSITSQQLTSCSPYGAILIVASYVSLLFSMCKTMLPFSLDSYLFFMYTLTKVLVVSHTRFSYNMYAFCCAILFSMIFKNTCHVTELTVTSFSDSQKPTSHYLQFIYLFKSSIHVN